MSQERTNFSAERRDWLKVLKEDKKILDFDSIDNKDIFYMMIALGCIENREELPELKKAESWIQRETYKTKGEALICSALLGEKCKAGEDINEYADFTKCNKYAEKCAEVGFDVLDKMVKEANYNNDELCAAFMRKLDSLYNLNVKAEDL